MNNAISEILKKLTICTMVLMFCFILFTPTANALPYDPDKYGRKFIPVGDVDPWDEADVYDPPPDDNDNLINSLSTAKISITSYLYLKLGWNFKKLLIEDTPIKNVYLTTPDDCDNNSKQTIRNR